MPLYEQIKNLREEMELTQEEFGDKINIHRKQLSHYETGKEIPTITIIKKIAEFYKVSIDYLVYGHDKKIAKQTNISDPELMGLFKRIDKLDKLIRKKLKWTIEELLNDQGKDRIKYRSVLFLSINEQLKKLRKEMGLSQNKFSAKININEKQLARYEAGRTIPSITILKKVADFCEVSIDYLVYGYNKEMVKKTNINDLELLDLLRRIDKQKKPIREKTKWVIKGLLETEEKK